MASATSALTGFVRGLLFALLAAGWIVATEAPSMATYCSSAGYLVDSVPNDNQYGARAAGNLVIDPNSYCGIVRSVYVLDSMANFVEVGWYEDGLWDPDPGYCDHVESPHILVYAVVNGFTKCKPGTAGLTAGSDYSFRVDNPDHDFDFVYYWDDDSTPDISLGYYSTDHRNGWPQMATERHDYTDSLRADLSGVRSLGGGGEWHAFPSPDLFATGDVSGFSVCSWSGTKLIVKAVC